MRYLIEVTVLLLYILNILTLCRSDWFSNAVSSLTCKSKNPAVSLPDYDISGLINFLDSKRDPDLNELFTVLTSVDKSFVDRFTEASEKNEDIHLNITELIKKYGFEAEEHEVKTNDGYVLTIHRIVGKEPIVFIMHGMFESADDLVSSGPDSLAILLASEGYDVWLGNGRGNKHSRKHVTLSPECEEFWEFSFDELGRYDLPAMIDYALDKSGKTKLTYVGFSQGTTNLLVLCSEMPEYNEKISLAALLAPIGFMTHMKSPIVRTLALDTNLLMKLGTLFGLNEITPNNQLATLILKFFCGNNPLSKFVCGNFLNILCGFDYDLMNVKRLPANFAHLPGGGSLRQLAHYGQEILSGKFRQFDFKKSKNKRIYGTEDPPEYPVEKITARIALFCGGNDWFSNITDVHKLRGNLPNVVKTKFMKEYNHLDMIWAKNIRKKVLSPLLKLIKKYQ